MFGPPGVAYVYFVYGMYHCLNVVTEQEGRAAALLVRAVEPIEGDDLMRAARREWSSRRHVGAARDDRRLTTMPASRLASGPGLLCAAFSISSADNGADLCAPQAPLRLESDPGPDEHSRRRLASGPRVGIDYAAEPWRSMPWRFWIPDSDAVSGRRRDSLARTPSGDENAFETATAGPQ